MSLCQQRTGLMAATISVGQTKDQEWQTVNGTDGKLWSLCFPSHEEELTHNTAKLLQVNKKHPVAKLKAVGKGSHSSIRDSEHGGDLLPTVFISKDAQVMLIYNLHVEFGLFNGAIGKVVDIIYKNGHRPPDCFPDAVMVKFHSYTSPSFIKEEPKVVPIVRVSRKIDYKCRYCTRK